MPGQNIASRIRVAIVDDHQAARVALRKLLADARDLEVIGEAATGQEALELCSKNCPDVILVDMHMVGMDGVTLTRALKQQLPRIKVVIVTMDVTLHERQEAFRLGADGLLLKGEPRREILRVIRRAR